MLPYYNLTCYNVKQIHIKLEEPIDTNIELQHDGAEIRFNIRPFQIVTLRLI